MKQVIYILFFLSLLDTLNALAQTDSSTVTLNQCVEAALIYNPTLKVAENEVSISLLSIKAARSGLYPSISSEASGGFSNEYRLGNNYKIGNANMNANQILWQNGKTKASVDQARFLKAVSGYNYETQKGDLIVLVKTFYFNCLLQNQLYNIALDNVSKAMLFLNYAQERYKIGVGRKSDVLKAESDLAEAEFDRDSFLNSGRQAQNELAMLTGLGSNRFSKLAYPWASDQELVFDQQKDSLFSSAIRHYPELQTIQNLNLSQQAKIRQVNAELFPIVSVRVGFEWSYNPIIQQQNGWFSLLSMRWTIFNGNERRYRIQTEQVRKKIYENQADETRNFLTKEINNRLISIKDAENRIVLSHRLMKTTSENLEIAKAQYKAGTGSMLELTDARVNDLDAKQKNIQAIIAFQIAMVNLERFIGNNIENKN